MSEFVQVRMWKFEKGFRASYKELEEMHAWLSDLDSSVRDCLSPTKDPFIQQGVNLLTELYNYEFTDVEFVEDNWAFEFEAFGFASKPDSYGLAVQYEAENLGTQELFEPHLPELKRMGELQNPSIVQGESGLLFTQFVVVFDVIYSRDYWGEYDMDTNLLGVADPGAFTTLKQLEETDKNKPIVPLFEDLFA